jgi:hypothetical protein
VVDEISIDYRLYVRRLQQTGSIAMMHQELPAPVDEFRRGLRRAARAAGIRVLTSSKEGSFIAWDPAFEVSAEALRAAMNALTILPSTSPTCPDDLVVMREAPGGLARSVAAASRFPRRSCRRQTARGSPGSTAAEKPPQLARKGLSRACSMGW